MADSMDSDVKSELQAMIGAPKVNLFGASRVQTRDPRQSKISRPIFSGENSGMSMNAPIIPTGRSLSPPPLPVLSTSDKAIKMELEAILRKPAQTPEEKFQVLEARDKLIRLTTAKTLDIKKVKSTKGICPDMCPEKERLSRESKHRVASFELKNGSKSVMDHTVAVKEYSRSSADQESPLPHELRPESTLKLTMTYLLQSIMDLCDDPDTSICDWYHFLWDRTRSIRKDITQQELCSTETVLLVEQCARFHIHCAARLVAEEPQVFDQKINTENLTKCLQSLKYMYHDLGLKMVRCPNEAEFRAYVVLLNLHDSNFLWEVKQLRAEILQSPEIQFAIKVYQAVESNNYVKFFALVRSTTYMNACILLRYFTQVRVKALQVIFKAYAPRNPVYMAISNLQFLLGFEDFEQCAQYMEYYGLSCDRDEDRVLLDRSSFYYPDTPFLLDRAINVVEHKRLSSVGEAVHGTTLDRKNILDNYEPHDSFDENGILLPEAWPYKPEARTEARMNRTEIPKEDESVFKMPLAPPKTSPKSRLSPRTIVPSENPFLATTNASTVFGSSKLAQSATSNSNNLFKMPGNQASTPVNVFSEFAQGSAKPNLFGNSSSFMDSQQQQQQQQQPANTFKSIDASAFKFSNNSTNSGFQKPSEMSAASNNIFASKFSQKPEGTSLFAKGNSTTNLFSNSASNVPSIFGDPTATASSNLVKNTGSPNFKVSTMSSSTIGSGILGNFKGASTTIPGVVPLDELDMLQANRLQREKEEARLKEIENKKREAEKIERQKRAELEEKERQRKRAEEEKKKERERMLLEIEKTSNIFVDEIIEAFVLNNLEEIAKSEIERYRAYEEIINRIHIDVLNEVIDSELQTIALDVKIAWDKNLLERCFTAWLLYTRKKIEQRRKIANTPVWLPTRSMQETIPDFRHPLQMETLSLMKRYRSGLPSKLIAPPIREDSIDLWSIITPELVKLTEQIKSKHTNNIYWKCIISMPDTDEDASSKTISQWIDNVFYRQQSKYPRQKDVFFLEQHHVHNQVINVCMRKLTGEQMLNESQSKHSSTDIQGTNAILFFLTTKNLHMTRTRLKAVLKSVAVSDATSLIIYSLDINDLNEVKNALHLDEYMDHEKVDDCVFANSFRNRSIKNLCHLTKVGLQYVAANSFYDDQLEMQQIVSFLRICLADELWQRIYLSTSRNPTLLEASTRFNFLVDYHNEAINRLISACTPTCLDSPTLFPFELRPFVPKHQLDIPLSLEYFPDDWHTKAENHQKQLVEFFNSLRINQSIDLNNISDTAAMQNAICKFVSDHIPSKPDAQRTAYKMIQHILAYLNPRQLNELEIKEKLKRYSWLDALPIFTTDFLSYQYQRFINEQRLPDYVIYDKYEYQEYIRSAWWLQTNDQFLKDITANVLRNIDVTVDEYEQSCKRQRLEETVIAAEEKKKLDDILSKGYATLASADKTLNKMKDIQSTCKDISKEFDYDLYRQEKIMRDMKDSLKCLK